LETLDEPVVILRARDCERLGQVLSAIVRGYNARNQAMPDGLLELSDRVNAARRAAEARQPGTAALNPARDTAPAGRRAGRDLPPSRPGQQAGPSGQPDRLLTTRQAAQAAGVGDDYIRRLCRLGTFGRRHGVTGAWLIDPRDLAAWEGARIRNGGTGTEAA
jgi:hypothetical protein